MICAVLFDLDGILTNTVSLHEDAFNMALFNTVGFTISHEEHLRTFNALPTKTKLKLLLDENRIKDVDVKQILNLKQEITINLIKERIKPDPEKINLHRYLKSIDMELACVTNSIKKTTQLILEASGQLEFMDAIITNEDCEFNKPHPMPYQKVCKRFALEPKETLALEDTLRGFTSAKDAGCQVKMTEYKHVNIINMKEWLDQVPFLNERHDLLKKQRLT